MTNSEIHAIALRDASLPYAPSARPCPRCGASCPCAHWEEIDIGVGVQVGDEQWICLEHGLWAFNTEFEVLFRDGGSYEPPPPDPRLERQINAMKDLARGRQGQRSAAVRRAAEEATSGRQDTAAAIGEWVTENVTYLRDPCFAEMIMTPEQMLSGEHCHADADDIATLIAAMARAIGLRAQLVVVAFDGRHYSHVFARVERPDGTWVDVNPFDGKAFDKMRDRVTASRVFPLDEEVPHA